VDADMEQPAIRFSDGASYEAMMGGWSRLVGEAFLDWISPSSDLEWIDIGCGSGAFTSLVVERCSPKSVLGIDPSAAQLDYGRARGLGPRARFERGDAMALDVGNASFDAAVAALVVHFMPDPTTGVSEMARVVRPGGLVAAYAWDLSGGGFPYNAMNVAMRSVGLPVPDPPHPEAAAAPELQRLWNAAGLEAIEQRQFIVSHPFPDFDRYWQAATSSPRIAAGLAAATADVVADLKNRVRASFASTSQVTPSARANAIVGRVPRA
jgi:ubiquinone/menaquinone biosynthesis C-methylase UbiE